MNSDDTLFGRIKNGVLTISGNNPSIKVDGGCLIVSDGPVPVPVDHTGPALPINERMVTHRFRRADCPISRIVITRPDGFITFGAIRWLHGVGASLMHLDWDGTVLLASGPAGPDRPLVRRAQALAAGSRSGLAIAREILRCKVGGQARVARIFGGEDVGTVIDQLVRKISDTEGVDMLGVEGAAASAYWSFLSDCPVYFARRDKVPDHWQTFGLRRPEGSGRPRNAPTPAVALLNYVYGVVAGEMTIALLGAGLDPGLGIFHADKDNRASLAYDAMEAIRPYAEAWLLTCLAESRFSKRDFYEEADGTIRITRPLTSYLAMTAPLWRRAADVVAGWLAHCLAASARQLKTTHLESDLIAVVPEGNRLAKPNSRESRSEVRQPALEKLEAVSRVPDPLPALPSPGRAYRRALADDVVPRCCYECGKALGPTQRRFCSASCAGIYRAEMRRLLPPAIEGTPSRPLRQIRDSENARSAKLRRISAARRAWSNENGQGRETQSPAYEQLRQWYTGTVQPRIAGLQPRDIVRAIDVSRVYARSIIRGQIPHPRHYPSLAELVGLEYPARF